jgi:hypothetical protein
MATIKKNSRKKGSKGKKTTTNSKKCEDKKLMSEVPNSLQYSPYSLAATQN